MVRWLGWVGVVLQAVSALLFVYSIYLAFVVSEMLAAPGYSWIFEAGKGVLVLAASFSLIALGGRLQWRVFEPSKHNNVLTLAIVMLLLGISGNLLSSFAGVISGDQDIAIGQIAFSILNNLGLLAISVWCYSRMKERDFHHEG